MSGDPHRFDDLFAAFGPIKIRRFFGGEGILTDEVMFGAVFDDLIYFHTNDETRASFIAEGCKPFTFLKRSTSKTMTTHWFAIPDRLYDDPEELAEWARIALTAMRNSPTEQKKRKARAAGKANSPKRAIKRKIGR